MSAWQETLWPREPGELYPLLRERLEALLAGEPDQTANLANAAALLWEAVPELNWAGFYLARGEELVLGPFQGKPACVRIPWGKGVCGTAAASRQPQLVPDVHAFPGHIPCDGASRSELVIPLFGPGGRVAGVAPPGAGGPAGGRRPSPGPHFPARGHRRRAGGRLPAGPGRPGDPGRRPGPGPAGPAG